MIEYPSLEIEEEDRLVALAIGRVSGGLTAEIVNAQIRERQELLKLIESGLSMPICPELTNANPSAPHTVLLEAFAWLQAQQAYRINRVPKQNFIAFANLFNITPRPATPAETVLKFTVSAPTGTNVTIPAGAQITDADGTYIFETISALVIPSGAANGTVSARRLVSGHTLLAPNVLTETIDPIAFVVSVTNETGIDSGAEAESLESTLNRVNRYQRRGERIVSAKDLEEAILDDALGGNGIVRAFPFIKDSEFSVSRPGHTTVVVMTKNGEAVDSITLQRIGAVLDQAIGNQYIYISSPFYVGFDVSVNVRLSGFSSQGAILAAIENNLRNFYAPSREQFGRPISRAEIIAVIEGTGGVDRIVSDDNMPILASPLFDVRLQDYQLPKLNLVTINVV